MKLPIALEVWLKKRPLNRGRFANGDACGLASDEVVRRGSVYSYGECEVQKVVIGEKCAIDFIGFFH
ncbi:hypothetical protein [Burkholderia sp. BDU5]|uniref:hypothetical protein n=1 Tax=Burkholderia sp. BDU5 TaxID=1385590 RepID=UPI0012E398A6|nr:hypothetical protein [Burkholderia sp. BDU5]